MDNFFYYWIYFVHVFIKKSKRFILKKGFESFVIRGRYTGIKRNL